VQHLSSGHFALDVGACSRRAGSSTHGFMAVIHRKMAGDGGWLDGYAENFTEQADQMADLVDLPGSACGPGACSEHLKACRALWVENVHQARISWVLGPE
jgi:hypothetical protein